MEHALVIVCFPYSPCGPLQCCLTDLKAPAPVAATGLLVAGLLALQYSDRLDGLLACWVLAVWFLFCPNLSVEMCAASQVSGC